MVRRSIDLSADDRDALIGYLGQCYIEDLQFLVKTPEDTPGRDEASQDAEAADNATERLSYADDLTEGELLRYVRMIEELPPESFASPEDEARRRDVAQRIRGLVRQARATRGR